ncbi:cytochrome P450 [Penicillium canariense]|uniref:Cytochrome P450 n=1 Tax=Penicillium canariense TaxID=189055 RepID=A0A9W9HMD8_9EURO|nr:cytochrome P450 [Penicillium canariense]KAJ5151378.1 cytochrome P450 [Penicillium canariense]
MAESSQEISPSLAEEVLGVQAPVNNHDMVAISCTMFGTTREPSVPWFLMDLCTWMPLSELKPAARGQVKGTMADLHNGPVATTLGEAGAGATAVRWGNLDNVSSVINNRIRLWEKALGEFSMIEACIASHAFPLRVA